MTQNSDAAGDPGLDPGRLLESLGQAVVATDPAGVVQYWNLAAEQLYGWTAAEALGRNIAELTVPQISQELAGEIMHALNEGGRWSGGFIVQRKDGSTFPALVTDTGIRSDHGELVGIVGVSTDVRPALRLLLAQSSDAALILSRQADVYYVSPAATELFGWDPSEVLGTTLWAHLHPDDRDAAVRHHALVSSTTTRVDPLECRLRCADGVWRWVEMVMTNMRNHQAVPGVVCHLRDVTERRQDRDRLAQLNQQLQTALTSRIIIEQAKGYLAGRSRIDPDTAFQAIRHYARSHNREIHDVARAVVAGELPDLAN